MLGAGTFEPDKLDLDGSTSRLIRNVLPKGNSYGPFPGPSIFGASTLPAQCVGFAYARTNSGGWLVFAGTKTKLYKLVGDAWVDYTRTVGGNYNVPDGDQWSFTQFGSQLIACNFNDDPQVLDVDTAAVAFTALGGSPPKARIVRATQSFVRLVGMPTDPYGDRWSDLEDAAQWTAGAGTYGLSDRQYFPKGGRVMNVAGGFQGFVFQEQAVQAYQFLPGSQYVWQYTEVEGARGCVAPYSVASVGSTCFYMAEDGFYSIDVQAGLKPIGATRVNNWWRDNTDQSRLASVMAIADPVAPRIYWVGYSTSGVTSYDVGLVYDWQLDQWAEFRTSAQIFAAVATPGKTLEALDSYGSLEDVPASLDASIWAGSKPTFGGIDANGKLVFMSGPNLEATMVFPRGHLNPGGRAFVNEVRPVIDTDAALLRIGTVERMQDAVAYGTPATLDPTGKFNVRSSGRIHEFELTIPAGATWTHCQGIEPSAVPDGKR